MEHLLIFIGCIFTILIEVGFFALFGYRKKRFVIIAILANLSSNLILNYTVLLTGIAYRQEYIIILPLMELVVYIYEVLLLQTAVKEKRERIEIIFLTLASNLLSFAFGIIMYSIYYLI